VPEQFALEELLGQGRTRDVDEGLRRAVAVVGSPWPPDPCPCRSPVRARWTPG
jgi:hypothetical protein